MPISGHVSKTTVLTDFWISTKATNGAGWGLSCGLMGVWVSRLGPANTELVPVCRTGG